MAKTVSWKRERSFAVSICLERISSLNSAGDNWSPNQTQPTRHLKVNDHSVECTRRMASWLFPTFYDRWTWPLRPVSPTPVDDKTEQWSWHYELEPEVYGMHLTERNHKSSPKFYLLYFHKIFSLHECMEKVLIKWDWKLLFRSLSEVGSNDQYFIDTELTLLHKIMKHRLKRWKLKHFQKSPDLNQSS